MEAKPLVRKNNELRPVDDITSAYANHVYLEPSFWDLKLIFGQLDQSVEPLIVEQHTEVTICWAEAKILHYFLGAQIVAHEIAHGKVNLSKSVFPPDPPMPDAETLKQEPSAKEIYEAIKKLRADFVAANSQEATK